MSIIIYPQPADSPGTPPLPRPNWDVIDAWLAANGYPPGPGPLPSRDGAS